MRKTSYESRAMKVVIMLVMLFTGCEYLEDFEERIFRYNATHYRQIKYSHGVSRIAIICADYVIKFDITPVGRFSDGSAGDIYSEQRVYTKAVIDGMEHLLAKTTVGECNGRRYCIMPRINDVGNWSKDWRDYCTAEEEEWLDNNLFDLHCGNVGYRHGKVCVIDYAWDAVDRPGQTTTTSSSVEW